MVDITPCTAGMQTLAWQAWNQTSTTQAQTWESWITNTPTTSYVSYVTPSPSSTIVWMSWNGTYEETREQAAARAERDAEQDAERDAATSRAEKLLLSLLTDEQAASYTDRGWFEVRGSRGGRWRIRRRGQAGNVDLMPEIGDVRQASFCCHPPGGLPDADAHVAQMLHLVTDEDGFRRTANQCYPRAM